MTRQLYKNVLFSAVILSFSLSAAAFADLGGVGSPVQASNAPAKPVLQDAGNKMAAAPADAEETAPSNANAPLGKPLILIRFNQKNVYFQDSLKKVVDAVKKTKPDAAYQVNSLLPKTNDGNATKASDANLRAVISELNHLGVPLSRLSISTFSSSNLKSQEIQIFVN